MLLFAGLRAATNRALMAGCPLRRWGAGLLYLVGNGVLTVAAQAGYVPSVLGAWAVPPLAILIG